VLIDPEIKATFKIDLDQIFPQNDLVEQTGASLFEHFATPLWGAEGLDFRDEPVELGMIAGTLVNERDIHKGIFFPDVLFPDGTLSSENHFFHSRLLMALSTEAEMMTRYTKDGIDGIKECIQRIHVTGGTNGILVASLFRHRPFTPSFMGRAEDQSYILSVLEKQGRKLAYAHKDGLVMRHDKEAFAADAIKAASLGKILGDYIRILYFSEYAGVLTEDITELKDLVDPFTGCFISRIPITEVFIRFCLQTASFFLNDQKEMGANFITGNSQRLADALDFVKGKDSPLKRRYELESLVWDIYYDTLLAIESALRDKDPFAVELGKKAKEIVDGCKINV